LAAPLRGAFLPTFFDGFASLLAHLIASFALLLADPLAALLASLVRGRAARRRRRRPRSVGSGFRLAFGFFAAALGHHDHQQQKQDRGGEGGDEPTGVVRDVVADIGNEHRFILAKDSLSSTEWPLVWVSAFIVIASGF
jgi:hypothetical protein